MDSRCRTHYLPPAARQGAIRDTAPRTAPSRDSRARPADRRCREIREEKRRATARAAAPCGHTATAGNARPVATAGRPMALTVSHRGGHCVLPIARALLSPGVLLRWEHVVVHRNDHRDEDDGVVEQMELDARNPDLHEARRHRPSAQVVARRGLDDEEQVLDVMEELD